MLHLLRSSTSLQIPHPFALHKNHRKSPSGLGFHWDQKLLPRRRNSNFHSLGAVDRDSEFEVDPVKAREALKKLDEQLQSLAQKQVDPPKFRASDLKQVEGQMREETTEISGSFLVYAASGLLIFTIFYNVLFLTVIKPAIDGQNEPVEITSSSVESEKTAPLPGALLEP
ncbi:uncharacterized protein [Coffea arabica]|uniref:Uncharacterized protein n=1 Tax=Coffea arabica TaxID=13443 RepID=A0A6P6T5F6_COFAR